MKIVQSIKNRIIRFMKVSEHVHTRQHSVKTLFDLVDLIDRFVYSEVKYPLEWDDFISWKHENINIEKSREIISNYEYLLFSKNKSDRDKYIKFLMEERNRVAIIIGLSIR